MSDRDLFIAALEQPEDQRPAWLDRACADDPDLRRRLDVLLRAHELASQFLASPAVEQLASPNGSTRDADPAKPDHDGAADVLALLAPPERPGQLGKLEHYEVLEVVGQGAMGVVVKAFDPKLHRVVAIKLMARHLAANPSARRRFDREAKAVAAVRDDHVVAIHDVETAGPAPYLVMEFIGGVSLQDRLDKRGPLDVKEILRIGMQTAQGLAAAHAQGLVRRDVKPANILLENGVERVKITDFGLARAVDDVNLTQSGVITGTPNYMSPEQADGRAVDHRSDLFSLGSVLYALATGHPPFRASGMAAVLKRVAADAPRPVREVNPDVPDWLEAIIGKLHAKEPAQRFQSAREVAELLGQHLAHLQQPGQVPRPPRVTPAVSPVSLRPIPALPFLIACLSFGALLTVAMMVVELWENPTDPALVPVVLGILTPLAVLRLYFVSRRRVSAPSQEAGKGEPPAARRGGRGLVVWWLAWCLLPVGACALGLPEYLLDLDSRRLNSFAAPASRRVVLALLAAWFGLGLLVSWLRLRRRPPASAGRGNKWGCAGVTTLCILVALAIALLLMVSYYSQRARPVPAFDMPRPHVPGGQLKIVKDDPDVEVVVRSDAFGVYLVEAGTRSSGDRWIPSDTPVHLSIRKGPATVHEEVLRLRPGETREIHVPTLVLPEQMITLVPKEGRFPTDVTRMQISPDRASVAVERLDGPIVVFDAATAKERFTIARPRSDCTAFGFTPDGKYLAFLTRAGDAESNSVLRVVDARDGSVQRKDLAPKNGYLSNARALAFSADGKRLAVASAYLRREGDAFGWRIHRWEWPSGKELPLAEETNAGTIEEMRFTPDGAELLAVTDRQRGWNWNWNKATTTNNWTDNTDRTSFDCLATGGVNKVYTAVIAGWNEATGKSSLHYYYWRDSGLLRHQAAGSARFASLALSDDGSLVAAGNKGVVNVAWEKRAAVRVWDTKSGSEKAALIGHTDWILDVAFTPDGKQVVSASKDGTVRWWNLP